MDETMIVQRLEKVQNKSLFFWNVHKTHKTYFLPWFLSCSLLQTLQKKTFFRFKAKKSCFSNFYWLDMFNCLVTTADTMCDKLENNFVSKLTLKERHNSRKNPQLCAQWYAILENLVHNNKLTIELGKVRDMNHCDIPTWSLFA